MPTKPDSSFRHLSDYDQPVRGSAHFPEPLGHEAQIPIQHPGLIGPRRGVSPITHSLGTKAKPFYKKRFEKAPSEEIELNLWGDFTDGPWKSDMEILAAAKAGKWYPGRIDLENFAKSGKRGKTLPVHNVWNLMCAIAREKPGSVGRVNIFTHANKGFIALSGRVVVGNVIFNEGPAEFGEQTLDIANDEGTTFSDKESKNITLERVRRSFTKKAFLVIYACHAGLDKEYLSNIAKLLGIVVKSFSGEIRYHPIPSKDGKKIVDTKYGLKGSPVEVSDFHALMPDRQAEP
ncbi:MAG: hypothetical protein HYR55_01885 [Acidobacteria bacterium]|nr:hypothetical protein [Acidobacteriota bacterium]MBI3655354.1 hypothetical protein [Acidobacteriota bacterium]